MSARTGRAVPGSHVLRCGEERVETFRSPPAPMFGRAGRALPSPYLRNGRRRAGQTDSRDHLSDGAEERVEPTRFAPAVRARRTGGTLPVTTCDTSRNSEWTFRSRPAGWFPRPPSRQVPVSVAEQVPVTVDRTVARWFRGKLPFSNARWSPSRSHRVCLAIDEISGTILDKNH